MIKMCKRRITYLFCGLYVFPRRAQHILHVVVQVQVRPRVARPRDIYIGSPRAPPTSRHF